MIELIKKEFHLTKGLFFSTLALILLSYFFNFLPNNFKTFSFISDLSSLIILLYLPISLLMSLRVETSRLHLWLSSPRPMVFLLGSKIFVSLIMYLIILGITITKNWLLSGIVLWFFVSLVLLFSLILIFLWAVYLWTQRYLGKILPLFLFGLFVIIFYGPIYVVVPHLLFCAYLGNSVFISEILATNFYTLLFFLLSSWIFDKKVEV